MYSVVLAAMLTAGGETPNWCHGCHGCHGCSGCVGSCHGGWGCRGSHGCHGCHGCGGGYAFAASVPACTGCTGSCYGCAGCYGCYGGCYGCYGGVVVAPRVVAAVPVASNVGVAVPLARVRVPASEAVAPARVTVRLPAEARLWVDGEACPLTSDTRTFATPGLQPGQQYVYNLRAEVVRDGETFRQSQRVVLAAGRQVDVTFGDLQPTSVARR